MSLFWRCVTTIKLFTVLVTLLVKTRRMFYYRPKTESRYVALCESVGRHWREGYPGVWFTSLNSISFAFVGTFSIILLTLNLHFDTNQLITKVLIWIWIYKIIFKNQNIYFLRRILNSDYVTDNYRYTYSLLTQLFKLRFI
jgi:hypothetical protein